MAAHNPPLPLCDFARPIAHSTLFEDPGVVKITAAPAHLLNGSKPLARFKKFIPPQHAPRLISALRPALKDQSIPFPEETTIESAVNNRHFIRQAAFPRTLDRLAARAHAYLKAAFRIAVVDPQNPGLHRRRAAGQVASLPVENPFTAEVRFHRRIHKNAAKELRLPVYPLKWWTGRSLESRRIQPLKARCSLS